LAATRSVIFDCDGVLVDSEPTSNAVLAGVLTEIGLPMTPAEVTATFKGRSWASCLRIVEERLGAPPPPELTERYRSRRDAALRDVRPVPGVVEALDRIALPSCVASSGDHAKMRLTLGATGLLARFEGRIFSATEVEHGKPAPDLFLHAAERMGFDPATTAVVEDSVPGVEAGVAAGMRVLAYASDGDGPALERAGGEVFDDMAELPRRLAR
jgi:HAD superfamily hydrolase (TIGR01509 family)